MAISIMLVIMRTITEEERDEYSHKNQKMKQNVSFTTVKIYEKHEHGNECMISSSSIKLSPLTSSHEKTAIQQKNTPRMQRTQAMLVEICR